jgi:hypothetical protein
VTCVWLLPGFFVDGDGLGFGTIDAVQVDFCCPPVLMTQNFLNRSDGALLRSMKGGGFIIFKNKNVSFCAVGDTEIIPDKFGTKYESVIVAGEIEESFDKDKQMALEGMLRKYSSDHFGKGCASPAAP